MDNVPSSAILAIVAIVLACLFAAFAFTTVQSQKSSGSNAMVKVEGMNTELDESDLTQYDGQILTGSQVVEVIKKLKDTEGLVVSTQNISDSQKGKPAAANVYGNNVGATYTTDSGTIHTGTIGTMGASVENKTVIQVDTDSLKAISNKNDPVHYITPSAKFRGTVHRNANTKSIDWIQFEQEGPATTTP